MGLNTQQGLLTRVGDGGRGLIRGPKADVKQDLSVPQGDSLRISREVACINAVRDVGRACRAGLGCREPLACVSRAASGTYDRPRRIRPIELLEKAHDICE